MTAVTVVLGLDEVMTELIRELPTWCLVAVTFVLLGLLVYKVVSGNRLDWYESKHPDPLRPARGLRALVPNRPRSPDP